MINFYCNQKIHLVFLPKKAEIRSQCRGSILKYDKPNFQFELKKKSSSVCMQLFSM